jgi:hypothetical protein
VVDFSVGGADTSVSIARESVSDLMVGDQLQIAESVLPQL